MNKLLLLTLITLSASAMQTKNSEVYFKKLPPEINFELFKFLASQDTGENLKKFYGSCSQFQESVQITKDIFKYLMQKGVITRHAELNEYLKIIKAFPVAKNKEFIDWLAEEKKRITYEEKLYDAIFFLKDIQKVKEFIMQDNKIQENANVALQIIICGGYLPHSNKLQLIKLFIENGADANVQCYNEWTPLASAILTGDPELIQYLITKKADANFAFSTGTTALHLAAGYMPLPNHQLIQLLLNAGANPNACNERDESPLSLIIGRLTSNTNINDEILNSIESLLKAGAKSNIGTIQLDFSKDLATTRISILKYAREQIKNNDLDQLLIRYGARE